MKCSSTKEPGSQKVNEANFHRKLIHRVLRYDFTVNFSSTFVNVKIAKLHWKKSTLKLSKTSADLN
jgi:hypothetical protein